MTRCSTTSLARCRRRRARRARERARARRRAVRPHRHLLAEGLHPAHRAVPRPLRLLHVREGARAPRRARTSRSTRSSSSHGAARRPGAPRRSSRWASAPSCATPTPRPGSPRTATPRRSTTSPRRARPSLDETSLLPHANAGALSHDELAALRPVAASQGMMLESLRDDLDGAPARAGQDARSDGSRRSSSPASSRSPSRPGCSSGSARTRADRLAALAAIAARHERHGHVQEVIVQNFLPKPRTADGRLAAPPRSTSSPGRSPRRGSSCPTTSTSRRRRTSCDDPITIVEAGADDLGGISPVTLDHVNPERAWPQLDTLAAVLERAGYALTPRLTVYPEIAGRAARWLDAALRTTVLQLHDAEGYGRERRVGVGRHRVAAAAAATRRPRRDGRGARGARRASRSATSSARTSSSRCSAREGRDVDAVCDAADELRREPRRRRRDLRRRTATSTTRTSARSSAGSARSPRVRSRSTCAATRTSSTSTRCRGACAEAEATGLHRGLPARRHPPVVRRRVLPRRAARGARGLAVDPHPRLQRPRGLRGRASLGRLARRVPRVAEGGGAEDAARAPRPRSSTTRSAACCAPTRSRPSSGSRCTRPRTRVGLRSNVTIMFGAVEHPTVLGAAPRSRTRALQRRTGGFTEFVPLPFVHMATPIYLQGIARTGPDVPRGRSSCTRSAGSPTPG